MITFQRTIRNQYGTRGKWSTNDSFVCYTLEPEIPALPAGKYLLQLVYSVKHKMYVPRYVSQTDPAIADRYIEVHPGNIYVDTQGCTLPGMGYDDFDCAKVWPKHPVKSKLGIVPGVIRSRETWAMLMNRFYFGKPQIGSDGNEEFVGGTEIEVLD